MNQLAREVAINVVANLVAAGVVYIAGTATGLFPAVPSLILLAGLVVGGACATVTTIVINRILGGPMSPELTDLLRRRAGMLPLYPTLKPVLHRRRVTLIRLAGKFLYVVPIGMLLWPLTE